jgi:hypothetical protein
VHPLLFLIAVAATLQQPAPPVSPVITDSSCPCFPGDTSSEKLPEGDFGLSRTTYLVAAGDTLTVPTISAPAPVVGPVIAPVFPTVEITLASADTVPAGRPMAREYSDAYYTRLTIHKYASYATIPLFVAEVYLGQKLYSADSGTSTDALRSAHSAVAYGIAGLFVVNTVTGVWNLWEARKDPEGRTRRYVHSITMIVADAGFVATGASAPGHEYHENGSVNPNYQADKTRHRNIAIASMSLALASYLMMLVWK